VKFTDLFGDKDAQGKKIEEFKYSLHELPIDKVAEYTSLDPLATQYTAEWLRDQLLKIPLYPDPGSDGSVSVPDNDETLWHYFEGFERHITEVLWKMERRGILVHEDALARTAPGMLAEIAKIEKEFCNRAGHFVNLNANAQLSELFFGTVQEDGSYEGGLGAKISKMTPGGKTPPKPALDKEVLERLIEDGVTEASMVQRHRKVTKMHSTYVGSLLKLIRYYDDGRIHPQINQYGAVTGRFSSNYPPSQTFPRPTGDEFGIRKAFVAPKGKKLIVADYEQIEMRIAAHFSQDKYMLQAIREGLDLHCFTVSMMTGIPYEETYAAKKAEKPTHNQELLLELRQDYKKVGFGILYGKTKFSLAIDLKCSRNEAQDKIDQYFKIFPGIERYIEAMIEQAKRVGFVSTIFGRRRRLENIHNYSWSVRKESENQAVNSPIQGTASDLIKAAMLRIDRNQRLNKLQAILLMQVHDELVLEAPEENVEEVAEIVRECMEHPFMQGEDPLSVPTPVSLKVVDNWAEGK